MVDNNVNQPLVSDRDTVNTALILPMASMSTTTNPQSPQPSTRSPPPILVDNFKNGNTT